jgi:hypothetical protein
MPIIARNTGSADFEPAPAGAHQAVCVDVVDKGIVKTEWQGHARERHVVQIRWQLAERNADGQRYLVVQSFTCTLHEKGKLRPFLESWRGRAFTEEELEGFDLEKLIGANCQLSIVHVRRDGRTYANIASIMPLAKGMEKLEPENYVRVVDREPEPAAAAAQRRGEEPWPAERPPWHDDDDDLPF